MGRTERSALRCVLVRTVIFVFLHAHVCTLVLVYSGDGVRKVWEASGCIGSDVIGACFVFGIGACFVYVCGLLLPPPPLSFFALSELSSYLLSYI